MSRVPRALFNGVALATASVLILGSAGCGSGSETSPTGSSGTESVSRSPVPSHHEEGKDVPPSGEDPKPSPKQAAPAHTHPKKVSAAEFETAGGDNSIPRFGHESQRDEFTQAEAALRTYLNARTSGEWGRMCAQLSNEARAALENYASEGPTASNAKSCGEVAASIFPPLSSGVAHRATVVEAASLRVDGDQGVLLFRGAGGVDYFIRLANEKGRWKLAAPAPSELP
jgi:hypothetical protein